MTRAAAGTTEGAAGRAATRADGASASGERRATTTTGENDDGGEMEAGMDSRGGEHPHTTHLPHTRLPPPTHTDTTPRAVIVGIATPGLLELTRVGGVAVGGHRSRGSESRGNTHTHTNRNLSARVTSHLAYGRANHGITSDELLELRLRPPLRPRRSSRQYDEAQIGGGIVDSERGDRVSQLRAGALGAGPAASRKDGRVVLARSGGSGPGRGSPRPGRPVASRLRGGSGP